MLVMLAFSVGFPQRRTRKKSASAKAKPIIFAVTDDGKTLEPIGVFDQGELKATVGGDGDEKELVAFAKTYYQPNTKYGLIFGGKLSGTETVKSSNIKSECGKNLATATTQSARAKLKGFVMGLATNSQTQPTAIGTRRLPTVAERNEIESLVRDEFAKQNVAAEATKNLHYQNLTALDVDNDGTAEMVGSYWVESSPKERNLLFFIAQKDGGKYTFGYSEYKKITPEDIMGGADIKSVESGTYNELLLDIFSYGKDTTAKIFTVVEGLEGNSFNVYARKDGKWTRIFEGSNYHCAF